MAIALLEGWTITSLETIEGCDRVSGDCIFELDEVKNFSLSNSEDTTDVTGKGGNTLFIIKKNKQVEGSGTSGYISGNLMTAQTGTDAVTGEVIEFDPNNGVDEDKLPF